MQVEDNVKILIGFVHKFEYSNEEEAAVLCGHPLPGRVYRVIKDAGGYRLHIGKENNDAGLDGWMLGKRLKNTLRAYSFDVEIITTENFSEFKLHSDDVTKMVTWLSNDNKDLLEYFNKTNSHEVPTNMLEQLQKLLSRDRAAAIDEALHTVEPELNSLPVPDTSTVIVLTNHQEIFVPAIERVENDGSVFTVYYKNGSTCIYPMMHVLYIHQNN